MEINNLTWIQGNFRFMHFKYQLSHNCYPYVPKTQDVVSEISSTKGLFFDPEGQCLGRHHVSEDIRLQ